MASAMILPRLESATEFISALSTTDDTPHILRDRWVNRAFRDREPTPLQKMEQNSHCHKRYLAAFAITTCPQRSDCTLTYQTTSTLMRIGINNDSATSRGDWTRYARPLTSRLKRESMAMLSKCPKRPPLATTAKQLRQLPPCHIRLPPKIAPEDSPRSSPLSPQQRLETIS
jgi:hypothetical protein